MWDLSVSSLSQRVFAPGFLEMHGNAAEIEAGSQSAIRQKSTGRLRLLRLEHLDGRTAAAKRARQLIEILERDLGGSERLSEGRRQLVQRAAVLGTFAENCEAQWLAGVDVPLADYLAAINSQRRVLMALGLDRVPHDVTPTLQQLAENFTQTNDEVAKVEDA
jgi:hypothetical protein